MRILYISPEHVSGTLSLFKKEHERRGDYCRFVTFWHSRWDFEDDICLDLLGMPNRKWVHFLRGLFGNDPHRTPSRVVNGALPEWDPGLLTRTLHYFRDELNWRRIRRAVAEFDLDQFDIVHLDGGMDFTRDARFAKEMKARGKHIVCYYHGSDLRSRGYIPEVEKVSNLRFTPEWDLIALDPRLNYLYLPIDTTQFAARTFAQDKRIRICHASRNPQKGTPFVLDAVTKLAATHPVELVLIENMPHHRALEIKATCDVYVDQLTNEGGWGYGMSAVEALAMGLPVVTNIPDVMLPYIDKHPFVQADPFTLQNVLEELITDVAHCKQVAEFGREWVEERHDIRKVGDALYAHYEQRGWLK